MNPNRIVIAVSTILCTALIGLAVYLTISGSGNMARLIPLDAAYEKRVTDQGWIRGSDQPEVTVIEYSDFQCPGCAAFTAIFDGAYRQTKDYARFVFRHYPLPSHNKSKMAAQASEAAGRQGRFWDMYSVIFANQSGWSAATTTEFKADLKEYASSLGLQMDQFNNDMNDSSIDAAINSDVTLGNNLPVQATPTIIVNDQILTEIPKSIDEFVQIIEQARIRPGA